jgi:hypothetical protein
MKFNGQPILILPPCSVYLHQIDFKYEDETKAYKALMAEFERSFENYLSGSAGDRNYGKAQAKS